MGPQIVQLDAPTPAPATSETPRTDEQWERHDHETIDEASARCRHFARTLERELTAATRRAEEAERAAIEAGTAERKRSDQVLELQATLRQVQAERNEANAKLDTILTDPDYVGGVPYWVAKHTDLAIKNLELATALAGAEKALSEAMRIPKNLSSWTTDFLPHGDPRIPSTIQDAFDAMEKSERPCEIVIRTHPLPAPPAIESKKASPGEGLA